MFQFQGSLPALYDRNLRSLLFEPFAAHVAERLEVKPEMRVLELACGTGIGTRALLARLPGDATLVATDISDAMLAVAQQAVAPGDPRLAWQPADAMRPPFDDGSFDAIVCQFGLMFFPDRGAAVREMKRVLAPGGQLLVTTWDALERNPLPRLVHDTLQAEFPDNPPRFLATAFGCHDAEALRALAEAAGFSEVTVDRVALEGISASAADAAVGLVQGSPVAMHLQEHHLSVEQAVGSAERAVAAAFGRGELRVPISALVLTARA